MTNFEHYRETIENLSFIGDLAFDGEKLATCDEIDCESCVFNDGDCSRNLIKWLYSKYDETPTLTEAEHGLCVALGTGWLARDNAGALFVYNRKPQKNRNVGIWDSNNALAGLDGLCKRNTSLKFNFITWDDAEPWNVEDLLKFNVKNR